MYSFWFLHHCLYSFILMNLFWLFIRELNDFLIKYSFAFLEFCWIFFLRNYKLNCFLSLRSRSLRRWIKIFFGSSSYSTSFSKIISITIFSLFKHRLQRLVYLGLGLLGDFDFYLILAKLWRWGVFCFCHFWLLRRFNNIYIY